MLPISSVAVAAKVTEDQGSIDIALQDNFDKLGATKKATKIIKKSNPKIVSTKEEMHSICIDGDTPNLAQNPTLNYPIPVYVPDFDINELKLNFDYSSDQTPGMTLEEKRTQYGSIGQFNPEAAASIALVYPRYEQLLATAATDQTEEERHVDGCFASSYDKNQMFILGRSESMQNQETSTLLHESLHAVYEDLSQADKIQLNAQLQIYYETVKNDPVLSYFISSYNVSDEVLINEIHSFIGEYMVELPTELEAHYTKYFANRKVLAKQNYDFMLAYSQMVPRIKDLNQKFIDINRRITDIESELLSRFDALVNQKAKLGMGLYDTTYYGYDIMTLEKANRNITWIVDHQSEMSDLVAELNDLLVNNIDILEQASQFENLLYK